MLLSAIYRILCVACLLYANFQLCCATDEVVDEQTARIFCMRNCSHLTKDVYTTQLSSEIWNHQSCFKQCLRNFGKDHFVRKHQGKDGSRRSKRETLVVQTNSTDFRRHEQEWNCTEDCEEVGNGHYLAINGTYIDVFYYKENGSIYANVTWSCPHALELPNLKSYKVIYHWSRDRFQDPTYCCRDFEKTDTSAKMNISLHGLKEDDDISLRVVPLPKMHSNESADYSFWPVYLSSRPTVSSKQDKPTSISADISPTDKPTSTPSVSSLQDKPTNISADISPTDKPTSTPSGFPDETSSSKLYTAVACVTFILVIGSTLIYWYRCRAGSARQDTDFEFDVFIIYNSADEEWVDRTLRRTLEEKHGLRCCVHYRDFIPGKPFRDNMIESVYKSKKTIAVVSHNFYKSDFCPEEMDIALHRSLQRGDDSVIVIKLDDVDKDKLPKALKERSYIDYEKWIVRESWEKKLIDSIKNPVKYKSSKVCFV